MADLKFKWASWTSDHINLNSKADDGAALSGSAIDNTTNEYPYIEVQFELGSTDLSAQDNPAIYIYILKRGNDGSTYEDGDATPTEPARAPDGIIALREVNAAQNPGFCVCMASDYMKILAVNKTGATLASSGCNVSYRLGTDESA